MYYVASSLLFFLPDAGVDASRSTWEELGVPDIEPAEWVKVQIVQTMVIRVDEALVMWSADVDHVGDIENSTDVVVLTSSLSSNIEGQ